MNTLHHSARRSLVFLWAAGAGLVMVVAGCGKESSPLLAEQDPNVFITVSLTGDGDGRIDVNSGALWRCTLAQGVVMASGSDATQAANHCDWETYDAGGGGQVGFDAVVGSGSVFTGWRNDCAGTDTACSVEWLGAPGRVDVSVGAEFLFTPSSVEIEVATDRLLPSATTQATATYTSPRTLEGVQYSWTSSNPAVASISTTGSPATITALSPGTTQISAATRGRTSNEVTVEVLAPQSADTGILQGVLFDVDGTTPVDSIYLVAGPVAGSTATSVLRTFTGRQDPESGVVIPAGGYRLEGDPGRYAVFTVGVVGDRYMSTRGDSANVFANQTDTLDLFVSRGDHMDMLGTDLGTIQATSGESINLVVDYQAWSYAGCPLCGISLGIGVDSTALAVYIFDQVAGTYPGRQERGASIPITVPAAGGTIYATLITTSTSATNIEPGLKQYRDRWSANVQGTTMIPIGTLSVN
jgi:hypothetical protein